MAITIPSTVQPVDDATPSSSSSGTITIPKDITERVHQTGTSAPTPAPDAPPPDKSTSLGHKLAIGAFAVPEGLANLAAVPYNLLAAGWNKWGTAGMPMPASDYSMETVPMPEKMPPMDIQKAFSEDQPNGGPLAVLPQPRNRTERIIDKGGQAVGASLAAPGGALVKGAVGLTGAALQAQDEALPQFAKDHPWIHLGENIVLPAIAAGGAQSLTQLGSALSPWSKPSMTRAMINQISEKTGITPEALERAVIARQNNPESLWSPTTLSEAAGLNKTDNAGRVVTLQNNYGVQPAPAPSLASEELTKLSTPLTFSEDSVAGIKDFGNDLTALANARSGPEKRLLADRLAKAWGSSGEATEQTDIADLTRQLRDHEAAKGYPVEAAQLQAKLQDLINKKPGQNALLQESLNVGDDRQFLERWTSFPPAVQRAIIQSRPDIGVRLREIADQTARRYPAPLPLVEPPPSVIGDVGKTIATEGKNAATLAGYYASGNLLGAAAGRITAGLPGVLQRARQSRVDAGVTNALRDSNAYLGALNAIRNQQAPLSAILQSTSNGAQSGALGGLSRSSDWGR